MDGSSIHMLQLRSTLPGELRSCFLFFNSTCLPPQSITGTDHPPTSFLWIYNKCSIYDHSVVFLPLLQQKTRKPIPSLRRSGFWYYKSNLSFGASIRIICMPLAVLWHLSLTMLNQRICSFANQSRQSLARLKSPPSGILREFDNIFTRTTASRIQHGKNLAYTHI